MILLFVVHPIQRFIDSFLSHKGAEEDISSELFGRAEWLALSHSTTARESFT
jgi:hypothetical protein